MEKTYLARHPTGNPKKKKKRLGNVKISERHQYLCNAGAAGIYIILVDSKLDSVAPLVTGHPNAYFNPFQKPTNIQKHMIYWHDFFKES